jgi:C4-dicarboxylate-specific signal transduction histidine kinase
MSTLAAVFEREDAVPGDRHHRRLIQELAVRASVALAVLVFDVFFDLITIGGGNRIVRITALIGLLVNVVYYAAARLAPGARFQAYVRMLIDVELITLGLYGAGGLGAAPYLGVYAVVPVYAGLVFSSRACLLATALAAVSYLAVALATSRAPVTAMGSAWVIAAFNLLVVAIVGVVTAILAEAYRRSRLRLAALNRELERANDESLRLNAEIQRSARLSMLGEGMAGVAHELNNVMNIVLGHVGLAHHRRAETSAEVARHLDRALEGCENATRILRNTLDAVREGSAEKRRVSLADVARRTVELKAYDLRRDGITIRVRFAEDVPAVHGVAFQLQQVLLNLITNAQQALREKRAAPRTIEIVGTADDGRAVIEVRDTGPGIPAETLPRLFTPFFTTKADGTGLGLTVSTAIIRDHDGTLTGDNRPEGGAVFRIELPASPAE